MIRGTGLETGRETRPTVYFPSHSTTITTKQETLTMNTQPVTPKTLAASVVAVPPLARKVDLTLYREENRKIIRHLESGGVSTLLYGGNANFYHVRMSEYESILQFLADAAGPDTTIIPSVGPAYGTMMDQARILREHNFSTIMVLPQQGITTPDGVASGIRHFVEAAGRRAVLYIKQDGYIDVEGAKQLMDDGLISVIKYAVVRDDPAKDDYLRALTDAVNPLYIMSGIGEQPAIVHLRDFGLGGFTSGCVCVAPKISAKMLRALWDKDYETAEQIRRTFRPLEDLRNQISPICVLHEALALAGIAETGPIQPLLSRIEKQHRPAVEKAAKELLAANK